MRVSEEAFCALDCMFALESDELKYQPCALALLKAVKSADGERSG